MNHSQTTDPEYAWVSRHTWQSWRERYKKNATRLDLLIAEIVTRKKPVQGEKGQYGYVRQAEEKPKRSRKKRAKNAERQPIDVDQYAACEGLAGMPTMATAGLSDELPGSHDVRSTFPSTFASTSTSLDRQEARKSPAEEEMEDEESEWAVRVGDAQPPAWGKRRASDEIKSGNGNKRARRK